MDTNAYIGIPFEACNCWGLVHRIYDEVFDVTLPDFDSEGFEELWQEIPKGQEQTGDVILLQNGLMGRHVGVVVSKGKMLHVERNEPSHITRYTGPLWKNKIVGFYRYAG